MCIRDRVFWFELELPVDGESRRERRVPVDVTGARILIVDDNSVNRAILSEQMAAWRFDSAACVDGFEALAVMRAATQQGVQINCVVLDYHMPGMNGGDVVKQMRGEALLKDIPVIMLTSVDQTEDGKVFSSLGIEAHLTKPARSSHLLENIITILQDSGYSKSNRVETVTENETGNPSAAEASSPAAATASQESEMAAPGMSADARVSNNTDVPQVEEADQGVSGSLQPTIAEPQMPPNASMDSNTEPAADEAIDVLVCEDNEVNQIVFTQILQSAGYSFHIAPNGKHGVEMMKRLSPSIILMDVSMPEMNGLQATVAIREIEKETGKHTPIIGVTAHAIKGDMEKCIEAGMDDYLSKPVSPDKLQEKIEIWMRSVAEARQA